MIDVVPLGQCDWLNIKKICLEFFQSLPETLPLKARNDRDTIIEVIHALYKEDELDGAVAFYKSVPIALFLVELGWDDWSGELVAFERALYVSPRHRGKDLPTRLVKATLAELTQYQDLFRLEVGTTLKVDAPHVSKLYRDLGFTEVTGSFTKELNHV